MLLFRLEILDVKLYTFLTIDHKNMSYLSLSFKCPVLFSQHR